MKHPTPEACRAVADTLDAAAKAEEEAGRDLEIRMWTSAATRFPCKTVCCHGGAYFLQAISDESFERGLLVAPDYEGRERADAFMDGAKAMAFDLGFESIHHLTHWAWLYSDLWGSEQGDSMFTSPYAFREAPDTISIGTIAAWWRAVADRIETAGVGGQEARRLAA